MLSRIQFMKEHNPKEFWKLVKSIKSNDSNNPRANGEGTNSARLFTPGKRKALRGLKFIKYRGRVAQGGGEWEWVVITIDIGDLDC